MKKLISISLAALLCAALEPLAGCAAAASSHTATPAVSASPAPAATETACSPSPALETTASPSPVSGDAAVTALVQAFGKSLQGVSLLDETGVKEAMQAAYGQYVTPELLQAWQEKPAQAPGRMVSSPWPDHIEVFSVQKDSDKAYTVSGQIAEITSDSPEAAARRAITLTVEKQPDGAFLISAVTLGNYAEKGPVVYKNSEYRFDFYLPADWEGYTVLDETWEGTPTDGSEKQTGPKLILRSPKWTQDVPYQDIPLLMFTHEQWAQVAAENLSVSAAPIPPHRARRERKVCVRAARALQFRVSRGVRRSGGQYRLSAALADWLTQPKYQRLRISRSLFLYSQKSPKGFPPPLFIIHC